jgi:invasion protein IalB
MKSIARAILFTAAFAIGLGIIASLTGSFLATHAVAAAAQKADPMTLAAAPKLNMGDFAVNTPIRTAAR